MSETSATSGGSKKRDKKNKKINDKTVAKSTAPVQSKSLFKIPKSKKEKVKEENNNINKKSPKLNVNISESNDKINDEIIKDQDSMSTTTTGNGDSDCNINTNIDSANIITEEFDFDDTDLNELNTSCENGVTAECNNEIEVPTEQSKTNNESSSSTGEVILISDNVDKQQQLENNTQSQITQNETGAIKGDCTPMDDCNNSMPLISTSVESSKRKGATPASLELEQNTAVEKEETYCPITPRRIVDVAEIDEYDVANRVLRSSSSKAIMSNTNYDNNKNAACLNDHTNKASTNGDKDDNDNYDDDDNDNEPDDELIVQFLDEANRIAEARLAARRQARAEAREIRMRELERQQKEQEQNADRVFDMQNSSGIDPLARARLTVGINSSSPIGGLLNSVRGNSMSSRRSSEDSLEEEGRSLRDIRHELRDVEERFRKAMIANAQLDNERASQSYQIQLLKDKLEEMEESYAQLQREFKEKSRDCNALKRNLDKLSEELKLVQGQLNERDTLIAEQGLVIVTVENEDGSDAKRALVSCENAHLLGSVQGSLDVRLKKFSEEKQQLVTEVQQLQEQLEQCKSQGKGKTVNGPTSGDDEYEAQREANKIISDFKYKLQKAEQEIANLQASLARSETQVIRYKSTAEAAEKAEAELKIERRKLQRENREAMERLEELETSNNHLLKRLDKLKNAKSALLKDL